MIDFDKLPESINSELAAELLTTPNTLIFTSSCFMMGSAIGSLVALGMKDEIIRISFENTLEICKQNAKKGAGDGGPS